MAIQHSAISDPEVHEPKGASTASAGEVYIADGAGSGDWELPSVTQYFTVSGVITDVSTASSIYLPVPTSCTALGATFVLGGAISGADAAITLFNSAGASLGSAVTISHSGSAAGDIDTFTATTNIAIAGDTFVRVTTDGASTNAIPLFVTVLFSKSVSA